MAIKEQAQSNLSVIPGKIRVEKNKENAPERSGHLGDVNNRRGGEPLHNAGYGSNGWRRRAVTTAAAGGLSLPS